MREDMIDIVYQAVYESWCMGEDTQAAAETVFLERDIDFDDLVYTQALLWLEDMKEDFDEIGGIK